jgi:D-aspartate ligase
MPLRSAPADCGPANLTEAAATPSCLVLAEEVWGSALHVARSLGRAGVPVYIATAGAGAAVFGRSRHCTAAADFDASNPERFCTEVRDWVERRAPGNGPIPVIALSDRLVEFLHACRGSFPGRFRLGIPNAPTTEALLNKADSCRIAERAGLDVPAWVRVSCREHLAAVDRLRLPVVVRPTRWSSAGDRYFKIIVFSDRQKLRDSLLRLLGHGADLLAQEYIEASDDDVEFAILWRSGDRALTVTCTGRKRRQSAPEGGVMVWGEALSLPGVENGAIRFLDESGFTGLGGIEFIRSGGQSWFIEFNPRLEAIHFLGARGGVDTVSMAYRELAYGEIPNGSPQQLPATAWVGSAWLNRLIHDPSNWKMAVADRVRFGLAPRRVRAVWSWRDPAPGIAVAVRLAYRGLSSLTVGRVRGRRAGG